MAEQRGILVEEILGVALDVPPELRHFVAIGNDVFIRPFVYALFEGNEPREGWPRMVFCGRHPLHQPKQTLPPLHWGYDFRVIPLHGAKFTRPILFRVRARGRPAVLDERCRYEFG